MPELRERDPKDKIKGKGGGRVPTEVRRQMTAKLRKELVQRQRGGEESPEAQAVSQTDEIVTAAVEEVSERAGQTIDSAVPKLQEHHQQKRTEEPTGTSHQSRPTVTIELQKENRSFKNQSIDQSIRERPRRSTAPKERPKAGASAPKTRQTMKQATQKASVTAKATTGRTPATKQVVERARQKVQQSAQRKLGQQAKRSAKAVADRSKRATVAVGKALAEMIHALAALLGGAVLVAALCVVILVAGIIASPFGILFSNEPSPGAVPLNAAVAQVNCDFNARLEELQAGDYDSIAIEGQAPDWREVVAVFAVKTAGATDGVDVAALTPDRVERLKAVFWDMCAITSETETINHPASVSTTPWAETILHITITAKTADEMRTAYSFTALQNDALTELLAELGILGDLLGDLSISQAEALALLQNLPDDLAPERKAVVKAACSLVGKVNYFWGGKSLVLGWDSRWGQLQQVWAGGSSTTGTYRPYGLDCSGFVDWVFYNASGGAYTIGHGGGAQTQHSYCANITWEDAQPGDLIFYADDSHVGIVCGRGDGGDLRVIHCSSGANNVVITEAVGFATVARPNFYRE